MTAAALGDEFVGGVQEESLNDLLRSLREDQSAFAPRLNIQFLDSVLNTFRNPPRTRQQEHFHTVWSTQQRPSLQESAPAVIEIADATASSGKIYLLYCSLTIALLPASYQEHDLHGRGQAVVLLDLSGRFSIPCLGKVMHSHIRSQSKESTSTLSDELMTTLVFDSLAHLHIFRPQSTSSLLATLVSVPSYLLSQPYAHFSANRALGLVVIHDLSAFLWQDRLSSDDEIGPYDANNAKKGTDSPFVESYRKLVAHLRNIHNLFSCTIIASNCSLSSTTSVMGQRALRPHLPAVWNSFCPLKVVVERDTVSRFRPGMSVEEALREKDQRWEAVEKSGYSVWVNFWGNEGWRDEVREAVKALGKGMRFSFQGMHESVMLDEEAGLGPAEANTLPSA
ncbi:MAG: hypothetical protein Q9163_001605 [Psora crenata]